MTLILLPQRRTNTRVARVAANENDENSDLGSQRRGLSLEIR